MRASVTLSSEAERDIEEITTHLATRDPDVAQRFARGVFETAKSATLFPRRFPLASEVFGLKTSAPVHFRAVGGFRRYLLFYTGPRDGSLRIVRVLHSARDLPQVFDAAA